MQRKATYFRTPQIGGATPRETEIVAFGLCNDRLLKASTPQQRIEALAKTQLLWSLLVKDLGLEGNRLPPELKQNLISLGFWAMAYATKATLQDLPLEPLIEVHSNIIDGLRAQQVTSPATAGAASMQPPMGRPILA
jgi:flagellar protein FlaF